MPKEYKKKIICIIKYGFYNFGDGLKSSIQLNRTADKPVLGSVTWSHFIFRFFETFCVHASWNKLHGSTNFITFGPTNQKLCVWKFEEKYGYGEQVLGQPPRVDHISPKRWAEGIRRFEKSPLRVSSLVFWTLPLHWEGWNLPFLMELGDFFFFTFFC
jgi:hypothetical protein